MVRSVAILALVLVLAGCGSGKGSNEQADPASTAPTATTLGCVSPVGAATSPRLSPALENRETMYLTGVTVWTSSGECAPADQVVFEFEKGSGPGPGFQVSYEPAASAKKEDGSGKQLEIAGSAFLVVKLTPAMTGKISGEDVTPTYTGPRVVKPAPQDTRFVEEVVKSGDFESVVTWVIGLAEKRPFKTTASSWRLAVEID